MKSLCVGAIMVFAFIESRLPTIDKRMSVRDKRDWINYWAHNAIPIELMFEAFTMVFNWKRDTKIDKQGRKSIGDTKTHDESKPSNEMEQSEVDKCLDMLQKCVPDIYKDLIKAKEDFFEYLKNKGKMSMGQFLFEKHPEPPLK